MPIGAGHCFAIFFVVIEYFREHVDDLVCAWRNWTRRGISIILSRYDFYAAIGEKHDHIRRKVADSQRKKKEKCRII